MHNLPTLSNHFARELPELSIPWQSEDFPAPEIAVLNEDLARDLGIDPEWLGTEEGMNFLLGKNLPEGATPVAQGYSGHQFGGFSPRLGDGRALLLGEITGPEDDIFDLHLKGSGPTPFSRGGDGRGALGPMLREYLISEAMHALGVPTTRALAVIRTGRRISRTRVVDGALLVRVAASHLRVGSFQYARLLDDDHLEITKKLADFAIRRHHPELMDTEKPYFELFRAVSREQVCLVARWMRLGFIHGVMNTDNTTISGETIDYGPCAFMDFYNPGTVFSSIDQQGRYAYGNQPVVLGWNLARFAETLLPLFDREADQALTLAQDEMVGHNQRYRAAWRAEMSEAIGLPERGEQSAMVELLDALEVILHEEQPDLTGFLRTLADSAEDGYSPLLALVKDQNRLREWLGLWRELGPDTQIMQESNPVYIPRNHLVEEALVAATDNGDLKPFHELLEVVTDPFLRRQGKERFEQPAPPDFGDYATFCGT
ncbi:protein adenylyltransferase SelO [Corynebacterium occultum]|uniref:protein adenylyltransferase SelO n=1 Tax=Corynebacterium occultum TaxID=2675219 RepID=UPI0018CD1CE1|nr:YdiU family protein [Corynebacterium occultum]